MTDCESSSACTNPLYHAASQTHSWNTKNNNWTITILKDKHTFFYLKKCIVKKTSQEPCTFKHDNNHLFEPPYHSSHPAPPASWAITRRPFQVGAETRRPVEAPNPKGRRGVFSVHIRHQEMTWVHEWFELWRFLSVFFGGFIGSWPVVQCLRRLKINLNQTHMVSLVYAAFADFNGSFFYFWTPGPQAGAEGRHKRPAVGILEFP